jgi:hypothetical protein
MVNFSSYYVIRFISGNRWYYMIRYVPNFIETFISHDPKTYIIQPPKGSRTDSVSKILGRNSI